MIILGSDFMYQNAYTWYTNLDKLIKYINLRVRAFFPALIPFDSTEGKSSGLQVLQFYITSISQCDK